MAATPLEMADALAPNATGSAEGAVDARWFAAEIAAWAVVYQLLVLNMLVPALRTTLSKQPFWTDMLQRPGQVLTNMAEESILTLACVRPRPTPWAPSRGRLTPRSLSAHHISAGALMLAGQLAASPDMWLHGLCLELAFELVDVVCLLRNAWPYPVVPARLKVFTLFHHLPGLCAAPPLVLLGGMHLQEPLQVVGWSLLLAGGVSLLTDGLKQTRSLQTQLGQWLALHVLNICGVLLARFYIYPQAGFRVVAIMTEAQQPDWLVKLAVAGLLSMAVFNVAVVAILLEKLVRFGALFVRHGGVKTPAKTE